MASIARTGKPWVTGCRPHAGRVGTAALCRDRQAHARVTQRIPALTLRQLERDGLVLRHDVGEVPPRVGYELSETGMELLVRMVPLWTWIVERIYAP